MFDLNMHIYRLHSSCCEDYSRVYQESTCRYSFFLFPDIHSPLTNHMVIHAEEKLRLMDGIKIIGYSSDDYEGGRWKMLSKKPRNKNYIITSKCCYCECKLNPVNYTREHITPKWSGGKYTKPACYECNQEKGGLLIDDYIVFLKWRLKNETDELIISLIETKIRNAKKYSFR